MEFEELLKRAMERQQPASGFTDRVLARTRELETNHPRRRFAVPFWLVPALAAMLVLAVALGYQQYRVRQQYRERQQGERAKEQLVVALHLTGAKLNHVRRKVIAIGNDKEFDR